MTARATTRSMRAFLWVAIALTFAAGTQLVVLAEHTDLYFAWSIDPPITAVFIGASFWAATVVLTWAARQRDWARSQLPVPSVAVVATLLLIATLINFEQFDGLLGALWVEVYAVVPPIAVALVVLQLAVPGADPRRDAPLPRWLRATLGVQAAVMLVVGVLLFVLPTDIPELWPWELSQLTSQAVGTWLLGIGVLAAFVVARDDRGDIAGAALSYIVLGAVLALGIAWLGGDIELARVSAWAYFAFIVSALGVGVAGAVVAWREGRYAPARPQGWIPVEVRVDQVGRQAEAGKAAR